MYRNPKGLALKVTTEKVDSNTVLCGTQMVKRLLGALRTGPLRRFVRSKAIGWERERLVIGEVNVQVIDLMPISDGAGPTA